MILSGLIFGSAPLSMQNKADIENLLIPSVMLKKVGETYEETFLDGKTVDDIRKIKPDMNVYILNNCYSFDEVLDIIYS